MFLGVQSVKPTAGAAETGPVQQRAVQTRQRLATTAMRLFREQGFDAVSIDEICSVAGVTKGAFYYHFPSKQAVLAEFATKRLGQVEAEVASLVASDMSTTDAILEVVRTAVRGSQRVPTALLAQMGRSLGAGGGQPTEGRHEHTLRDAFEKLLRRGQSRREVASDVDVAEISAQLAFNFQRAVQQWAATRRGQPEDVASRWILNVLNGAVNSPTTSLES